MFKIIVMAQKIKTALISFGMSGRVFHGPLLKMHPGFEVVKVMQRSSNSALSLFPGAAIVRQLEAILNDPTIELVIVNAPDDLHYEQTKAVLLAGKHAVVEKPFVQKSQLGEELIQLASKKGLLLTVFQNRRWDNSFLTVQKILKQKMIGRLVEYEANYSRYRTGVKDSWKEQKSRGAGILYNLGSHLIDQALVLFGLPQAVDARLMILRSGSEVDDFFDLRLLYADKSVRLKASYLVREEGPTYVLHGERGSFIKYGLDPQEAALNAGHLPNEVGWGRDPESLWGLLNSDIQGLHFKGAIESIPGNYSLFYDNLYNVIRHGETPAVAASEALNVIRVIEAALVSQQTQRCVSL